MPGYHNETVYVRPTAQDKYTYIEAETACKDLNATVVMAVDERNKGYLEFVAALKFGFNMDTWYFKGPILRSDSFGVPDANASCYALQPKNAPDGRRYTAASNVDCEGKRNVICEMPRRRDACGSWKPASIFNGSCYKVITALPKLKSFPEHGYDCSKLYEGKLASVHSDEEMRHVLNLFASQLERDTEAGLLTNMSSQYHMAFLGVDRTPGNDTPWGNYDDSTFDYGDPMGEVGRWPWCRNAPDGNDTLKSVVRLGPFNYKNESVPFENPRNYGCWHDGNAADGSAYAICKKKFLGNEIGSSRFFYYEPERSPTPLPTTTTSTSTTTIIASTMHVAAQENVDGEAAAVQLRQNRRPDRHA